MKKEINKEQDELFIPKTKNKVLKIILAIILIGALCTGGYLLYQDKFNNPKAIVKRALTTSIEEYKSSMNIDESMTKYKFNGLIKMEANLGEELLDITEIIKNIDLQFSGEADLNNSISNININSRYKDEKLLNFRAYFDNDNAYLLLEDIYDKYIKLDNTANNESLVIDDIPTININPNDTNTIINSIHKAFNKEIDKLEFKKENATITIDEKEVDVLNNYVIIKGNKVIELIKNITNNLANDNELITILKKLTNNENIKSDLLNSLDDFSETSFNGEYRINFYTDKGLLNKKLISIRQDIIQDGITTSFNIDKIDNDEYIFSISSLGTSLSIKIKKNNSNFNFGIKMRIMEMFVNLEVNMNFEKINEVTKPEITNYKNIDDLTDQDIQSINDAIEKNETLNKLIDEIESKTKKEETS